MNLTEIGKTISAASEAKIRAAIDALQALLGTGTTEESAEAVEALRMLQEAEMSHDETRQALRNALKASDPTGTLWPYIRDVYDSWFVYEDDGADPMGGPAKLYKRSYALVDGAVTLGDPTEVYVVTTYQPVGTTQESADLEIVGDLVPLVEKAVSKDGTVALKIIQPGWGSSGHYPAEVLKRDGPKVFKAGLHMHIDHPTPTEEAQRPERSVNTIGAVLVSDARWQDNGPAGPGLYAEAKPFSPFKERLEELAPHIGVSIRALGKAKTGEVDGRKGPIVEAITAAKSVDFVTLPGAGGQVLSLFEAARGGQAINTQEVAQVNEQEAQALREAQAKLEADNARLREALLLREARDFVAAQLATVEMPELTRARLTETLSAKPAIKDGVIDQVAYKTAIDEAVKSELEYLAKIGGTGTIRGMGASETPSDADHQRVVRAFKESFLREGKSPEEAQALAERAASF